MGVWALVSEVDLSLDLSFNGHGSTVRDPAYSAHNSNTHVISDMIKADISIQNLNL